MKCGKQRLRALRVDISMEWMGDIWGCIEDLVEIGNQIPNGTDIIHSFLSSPKAKTRNQIKIVENVDVKCVKQSWENLGLQHLSEEGTCLEISLYIQSDSES